MLLHGTQYVWELFLVLQTRLEHLFTTVVTHKLAKVSTHTTNVRGFITPPPKLKMRYLQGGLVYLCVSACLKKCCSCAQRSALLCFSLAAQSLRWWLVTSRENCLRRAVIFATSIALGGLIDWRRLLVLSWRGSHELVFFWFDKFVWTSDHHLDQHHHHQN